MLHDLQCSFIEYRGYKVVYRRYASLFFVVAVDGEDAVIFLCYFCLSSNYYLFLVSYFLSQNELAVLEFIHSLVETLDKYFESVCELDIMFHIEKAHYIVDEMVANGCIVENNKANILKPLQLMDKIQSEESFFSRSNK
jgi:AP-4 complex subunit sigma-1